MIPHCTSFGGKRPNFVGNTGNISFIVRVTVLLVRVLILLDKIDL